MMLRKMCLSVWRISQTERGRARARAGGGKDQLGKSVVKCRCYRWATHTCTYILVTFLEDSKLTAMLMLGGYSVVDFWHAAMRLLGCFCATAWMFGELFSTLLCGCYRVLGYYSKSNSTCLCYRHDNAQFDVTYN